MIEIVDHADPPLDTFIALCPLMSSSSRAQYTDIEGNY